jgi:hypothetical protein
MMDRLQFALKSPFDPPFFKGGIFSAGLRPLFGKEGKGRFWWSGMAIIWRISWIAHQLDLCSKPLLDSRHGRIFHEEILLWQKRTF